MDLRELVAQVRDVRLEVNDFLHNCSPLHCSEGMKQNNRYLKEIDRLEDELKITFSLFGKHRSKRSINFIGSGLKYLFGTMDHDDEKEIKAVIQNVGERQDEIVTSMKNSIRLISNISSQWEVLKENQQIQLENFKRLKEDLVNHYAIEQSFENKINGRTIELHFNNLILAIQVQIDKVKNAILFLKMGIVDPYFVSPQELLDSVQLTNLGYNLTLKDISIINSIRKPITIVDDSNNQIIIIFNFPVANPIQYKLFENLIIPKHSATGTVVLKNIPKYFASSFDNIHFLHFDSLDGCEKLTNSFICKSSIVLESGNDNNCISNLFYKGNDSYCDYFHIKEDFNVHNTFNNGFVLSTTKSIKLNLICGNYSDEKNMTGSYLIQPPNNCSVTSKLLNYHQGNVNFETHLVNKIPTITCCSKYFTAIDNVNNNPKSFNFTSLHDLKTLDSSFLKKSFGNWKKFEGFQLKEHVHSWYFYTIIGLIILVVIFYLRYRCKNKPQTNVVVQFDCKSNKDKIIQDGFPMSY